jgi:hypothetical protein
MLIRSVCYHIMFYFGLSLKLYTLYHKSFNLVSSLCDVFLIHYRRNLLFKSSEPVKLLQKYGWHTRTHLCACACQLLAAEPSRCLLMLIGLSRSLWCSTCLFLLEIRINTVHSVVKFNVRHEIYCWMEIIHIWCHYRAFYMEEMM